MYPPPHLSKLTSKREGTIVSDEIMAVSAGNTLKQLFQTPDRSVSFKRVFILVTVMVCIICILFLVTINIYFRYYSSNPNAVIKSVDTTTAATIFPTDSETSL